MKLEINRTALPEKLAVELDQLARTTWEARKKVYDAQWQCDKIEKAQVALFSQIGEAMPTLRPYIVEHNLNLLWDEKTASAEIEAQSKYEPF